jgi:hypothetical protein
MTFMFIYFLRKSTVFSAPLYILNVLVLESEIACSNPTKGTLCFVLVTDRYSVQGALPNLERLLFVYKLIMNSEQDQ